MRQQTCVWNASWADANLDTVSSDTGRDLAFVTSRSVEVFVALSLNNTVTITGLRFQTPAVKNRGRSTSVTNQAGLLQVAGCLRNPFTPHAQHVRHKFLGHAKLVYSQTIASHQ